MAVPNYQPPPEDAVERHEIALSGDQYLVIAIHENRQKPGQKEIGISRLQQSPEVAGVEQTVLELLNYVVIEEDGRVLVCVDRDDWEGR